MKSRSLQLLEFFKVLERLASFSASAPGAEACLLLRPLEGPEAIVQATALLDQAQAWREESSFTLASFTSLDGLFTFLDQPTAVLDADALFALRSVLEQAYQARQALVPFEDRGWDALMDAVLGGAWPERTVSGIRRCLDPEGHIRDEASPELAEVRGEIRSIHRRCTKQVKDFLVTQEITHYLQDEYMTVSSDRYVVPLKSNFKKRLPGIIHDYSQTGETCFFEPMFLVETNNRLQELKREEREEERKVLTYLTNLCRAEQGELARAYKNLVQFDVLMAKVSLAQAFDGRSIELSDSGELNLAETRHPLLALADLEHAQPIDIELPPDHRALVVSGGNAGGKTVCLKTLGLVTAMAYCALPVPVREGSCIPYYSGIHVILGDEQSIEESVSTFTAQIRHLTDAWNLAEGNALFLLDEFGAGTDPAQGAALAQAVIDSLMERGATVVAATHFPALKAYAMAAEGVRAASVLFDPNTKKPLFKIAYDQVGASIALDVARDHGLPEEIVTRAEQNLLIDGTDTTQVLDRLNAQAVKREQELEELRQEKKRLTQKRDKLDQRFDRERTKLIQEVRDQAQAVLKEWQEGKQGRKATLKKLAQTRQKLEGEMTAPEKKAAEKTFDIDQLHEGMNVMYPAWGKPGVIRDVDRKKKRAKVDIGGVVMWLSPSDLAPGQAKPVARSKPQVSVKETKTDAPAIVLDLRGQRADEALSNLERFVDDALLSGRVSLEIIHGRGTGALRREVHEYLRLHPAVDQFGVANEDRGGDGMTEVTLK